MWLTENIRYGAELGYVMLQLPSVVLPPFIFEGVEYEAKEELHCSLLCTKKLAEVFADHKRAATMLIMFVEEYVQSNALDFGGFADRAYVCRDGDARSIVIGAKINGIDQLFDALRSSFDELSVVKELV